MKRFFSILLVVTCLVMIASPAYALKGTFTGGGYLRMREEPNTNCTVLGYIMPGESVTIIHQLADEMPFAYCSGYVWKYRNGTGSHEFKYGYCSTDYLQIGSGTARVNVSPTAFIAEACFG